ncbi:MAG TPA: N-acyl homoserine lactonase family protein [Candidatus Dormibacteraeota bacterium]
MEIVRLHLASLRGVDGLEWPVHGFLIKHPKAGGILVDTGVGGPDKVLTDWRVVNHRAADVLAAEGLTPGDVKVVINTHLHFDHAGQNAVFKHAPFYVQRAELERARRDQRWFTDWFDFMDARFELLEGEAEIAEGVRVVPTPGHTAGHQSVLVEREDGGQLMIGDAAYTPAMYSDPDREDLPPGQAADRDAWSRSLRHLHALRPAAVHFCHHTEVVHS